MNKVGIIIPFFEYYNKIEKVCASILENNDKYHYEIFIVDNSKNKRLPKDLKNVHWIDCKSSIGFARACNVGAKYAFDHNCEYICFLNQDVIVKNSFIDVLIGELNTTKNSIYSPVISDGQSALSDFFKSYYFNQLNIVGKNRGKIQVKNLTGACFALRISDFYKINGFNPLFHMYYEDVDFFSRALLQGYKLYFVENAILFHLSANDNAKGQVRNQVEYWKHNGYVIHKMLKLGLFKGIFYGGVYLLKIYFEYFLNLKWKLLTKFFLKDLLQYPIILIKYLKLRNYSLNDSVSKDIRSV